MSWFDRFSRVKMRAAGKLDVNDPASYKRFKTMPKTANTFILYRGDTRSPDEIRATNGFFPQHGRAHVSESGGSTAMVCLTLSPSVSATYYSIKKYFNAKFPSGSDQKGFVYAVFLPTGRGILNYEMARAVGSNNLGSQEISTLVVPWPHVVGWRKLPLQDDCKCRDPDEHLVNWDGPFTANPDFDENNLAHVPPESLEALHDMAEPSARLLVYNGSKI